MHLCGFCDVDGNRILRKVSWEIRYIFSEDLLRSTREQKNVSIQSLETTAAVAGLSRQVESTNELDATNLVALLIGLFVGSV